jgi:hypothetical protein
MKSLSPLGLGAPESEIPGAVRNFTSVAPIPPDFNGVAQIGTQLYIGDGTTILPIPRYNAEKFINNRTICDWQPNAGTLSVSNGTFALDNSVLINSKPTVKATLSATSPFTGTYTFVNPVSIANFRSLSLMVRNTTTNIADTGMGTTTLLVALTLASAKVINLKCVAIDLTPGVFNLYSWNANEAANGNYFTYTGGAASSDITGGTTLLTDFVTSISITTTNGAGAASYPLWFGPLVVDAANDLDVGVVSWIFDKNMASQGAIGSILDQENTKACFALIPTSVGSSSSNLSTAQVADLYNSGHDLIHHTYSNTKVGGYVNSTDWPTGASITNDILNTWSYLKTNGWTRGIGFGVVGFNSAFTSTTATLRAQLVRDAVTASGMKAWRSGNADVGRQMLMGNSKPTNELKTIYSQLSTGNTTTLANLTTAIDLCATNKSHLIISCHGLDGAGNEGLTTQIFTNALTYAKNKSGIVNMKFTDACKLFYL